MVTVSDGTELGSKKKHNGPILDTVARDGLFFEEATPKCRSE